MPADEFVNFTLYCISGTDPGELWTQSYSECFVKRVRVQNSGPRLLRFAVKPRRLHGNYVNEL